MHSKISKAARIVVILLVLNSACQRMQATPSEVPLLLGGSEEYDACASFGVTRYDVALRRGPAEHFSELRRLSAGTELFLCDSTAEGDWISVVYPEPSDIECGVSSPLAERTPYTGPCLAGWLPTASLKVLAG